MASLGPREFLNMKWHPAPTLASRILGGGPPIIAAVVLTLSGQVARACPLCASETGIRVRREIFGPDLWWNLSVSILPFVVFFSVAAWVHIAPTNPHSPEDRS